MRIAYLDCGSGISGDMFLGALIDAGVPIDAIITRLDSLGLRDVRLECESVKRRGFRGTKVHIRHPPEHAHRHLRDINAILAKSTLNSAERSLAESVFRKLADAEARVHGTSVDRVHFHEVGAIDSIVDIVAGCIGWLQLDVGHAWASPVAVGSGFVEIAHGRSPVPAPATAELLRGIPLAKSPCQAELTTPTGAALLACLVNDYGPLPPLRITALGYGAGTNDFPSHPNLLRLILGDDVSSADDGLESDEVTCLETNVDDSTGEMIARCIDRLMQAGALDAFATPIVMKKGRPAVTVSVLCQASDRGCMEAILFQETSTIGIRHWTTRRSKLPRRTLDVVTPFGTVRGKVYRLPDGSERFAAEYESCRQCADEQGVPLREVIRAADQSFHAEA